MTITLDLPWTKPPLGGNDRGHTRFKAAYITLAHSQVAYCLARAKLPRLTGAEVTLHYRVPDKRRRDADNLGPTLKVCLDALVRADVLPDDSWVHVPRSGNEIHPPTSDGPAMWLEIRPLGERP